MWRNLVKELALFLTLAPAAVLVGIGAAELFFGDPCRAEKVRRVLHNEPMSDSVSIPPH